MSTQSLRNYSAPNLYQRDNSCAEHAVRDAVYTMTNQSGPTPRDISIYQPYWDARVLAGTTASDPGTGSLGDLMNLMTGKTKGYAESNVWANDPANLYVEPTQAVYDNAATFKIESYRQLDPYVSSGTWVRNISEELSHGKPVIVVLNSLEGVGRHVVTINATTGVYGFENWWYGWGDNGYGEMSYSQNTNFAGAYVIDKMGGKDYTWTDSRIEVAKLYGVLLGRCGENPGVVGWAAAMDSGVNIVSIANAFYSSAEGQAIYGTMSNDLYAATMYKTTTGRDPRQADIDYFSDILDAGTYAHGELAYALLDWVSDGNDTIAAKARMHDIGLISGRYAITAQIDGTHGAIAHAAMDAVQAGQSVDVTMIGVYDALGW